MSAADQEQHGWFGSTQWTVVLQAREQGNGEAALRALENLCRIYWKPLYGYVRRRGYQPSDAEDLTQGFFAHFLEKKRLGSVDREKGRFRTFLLVCLNNFLRDDHAKRTAKKRGGGRTILSLDWEGAESDYQLDPPDKKDPEYYFEKKWAMEILQRALLRLKESYVESDRGELFEHLKPYLTSEAERGQFTEIGNALGMKETAVRVAVSRLRKRYRAALRAEVSQTVGSPEEAEEELNHIFQILTSDK